MLGSKGALRFEIVAQGRMAHSAYPHLGESAIEKLLDALERVRKVALPHDAVLGHSTMNIGTIQGGRAPNVIPDHAMAEVFFRLVDDGNSTRRAVAEAVDGQSRRQRSAVHSGGAYGIDPGAGDLRGGIHDRHSGVPWGVGHAVFVRAGKHSRRAHRPGAHCEARHCGGD